mmetsp:Transcript_3340/g.4826  ORF Transcript_3340/g.4826 Transcript_3340/m.4826 type:complete len:122 (-) Transcript_3340:112-477(-)
MGRDAGFITMEACNASRDVNIALVPEFEFDLYGKHGLLEYVNARLLKKRHCVIVVAEGAGRAMRGGSVEDGEKDASGHIKAGDIGIFLKEKLVSYGKSKGIDVTLKYIDPSYIIRSCAAIP